MSTLGYWKIRGYVHQITLMLEYVGETYNMVEYQQGDGPEFSRECWYKVKSSLGLDFPNLPYYKDEHVNISQSITIMRYLARKHKLGGSTEEETLRVDMVIDELLDFRAAFTALCYNPDYENLRAAFETRMAPRVEALEKYLGDRQWFAGETLTFADFMAYEILQSYRKLDMVFFHNTPKLDAFTKRFEELPRVKEYLASGKVPSAICNRVAAVFNS